jgi:hypothetical protein
LRAGLELRAGNGDALAETAYAFEAVKTSVATRSARREELEFPKKY